MLTMILSSIPSGQKIPRVMILVSLLFLLCTHLSMQICFKKQAMKIFQTANIFLQINVISH